jgi:steroid delta-isomerase-like uncharacterized protein
MAAEDTKALYRQFVEEVINRGNLAAAEDLVSPEFVDHAAPPGTTDYRRAALERQAMLRSAFPDLRLAIEDQLAEGDKVVTRFTVRGTHQGAFMGLPPTGKPVAVTGIDITRWRGGKLAEHWVQLDTLGLLQQLGALPPSA